MSKTKDQFGFSIGTNPSRCAEWMSLKAANGETFSARHARDTVGVSLETANKAAYQLVKLDILECFKAPETGHLYYFYKAHKRFRGIP